MPIKNYKGAGKGRVRRDRGFFFFLLLPSVLTQQCLSDRAAVWHDGIYFVSSLIHSDKALLWISMKDTRGQIHEAQTNSDCPVSLLVFWYSDPAWTECHVCHRGGRKKKKKKRHILFYGNALPRKHLIMKILTTHCSCLLTNEWISHLCWDVCISEMFCH